MVHMVSVTGAFTYRQTTAYFVANMLLERITSIWGSLLELHSEWRTHFTGKVLQQVCAV